MLLFSFFLKPISEHSFILTAAMKMYTAQVQDDTLLHPNKEGSEDKDKYQIKKEDGNEKGMKE